MSITEGDSNGAEGGSSIFPAAPTSNGQTAEEAKVARKPRGKGIIYFGLRDADEALRKIDQYEKRMSKDGFALALGHQKAQNRFEQKVDALRQFTLLEEDGDDIRLTPLATDMLYAGSEAARNKARANAFLAYPDFKRTFVECPKGQDHPLSYVREFAKGKLGIINEVDRFLKLFLESAHFSGLLEGQPDPKVEKIRLRPAVPQDGGGGSQSVASAGSGDRGVSNDNREFSLIPIDEAENVLSSLGLSGYRDRCELYQVSSGRIGLTTGAGSVTIEVQRPVRITIRTGDVLSDLVELVSILKERGYQA